MTFGKLLPDTLEKCPMLRTNAGCSAYFCSHSFAAVGYTTVPPENGSPQSHSLFDIVLFVT